MKAVILAGGLGSRISEESSLRPKPMIEIGGKPILWHIMKIYSTYGINEFIVCAGYKGYMIKEYFSNYFLHMSDVTFDMEHNRMEVHAKHSEPWRVTIVDTGEATMTGGRVQHIQKYVQDETFMLTYGDGVADINITTLLEEHRRAGKLATLTGVQPPGRWGSLDLAADNSVHSFLEKPVGDGAWINGGFFVLEPEIFDYIEGPNTVWEQEPLRNMSSDHQLHCYRHNGFWRPMDTLRDKIELEQYWQSGNAPWKLW